jgi:hypothetical protein
MSQNVDENEEYELTSKNTKPASSFDENLDKAVLNEEKEATLNFQLSNSNNINNTKQSNIDNIDSRLNFNNNSGLFRFYLFKI